jgi:hypothetical protein
MKHSDHNPSYSRYLLIAIAVLLVAGLACSLGPTATPAALTVGGPTVTLTSPVQGQKLPADQPVAVNSTSVDTDGVQRVELWVDGAPVRVDSNPAPSSPYIVSQTWPGGAAGTHVIQVKAFDAKGAQGQSQPVTVVLEAAARALPESTPVAGASPTSGGQEPPPTWTPTLPALQPTWTPAVPPPPATWTPSAQPPPGTPLMPSETPVVMCTPPPCQKGEVYYCSDGNCPGGCGTTCATPTPTPTPPNYKPTGIEPHAIFKPVWDKAGVKEYIGYPTAAASDNQHYARQFFDHGFMYWWENKPNANGAIWVVEMTGSSTRQGTRWSGPYADTWKGDPYSCEAAKDNEDGPIRGFGKVWCEHPEIAKAIGDPREGERGTGETASYGAVQVFQGGIMLYSPLDREVWVLFNGGAWQRHSR